MRNQRGAAACAVLVCGAAAPAAVRVVVRVPPGTAGDVYLAGSAPAVGAWRADGLRLAPQPDGTYAADADLPPGSPFKFTRGTWATVEQHVDGTDRDNRSAPPGTAPIEATVERWADGPATRPAGTVVGRLELHDLDAPTLGGRRTVRVWLPPGYDARRRYPALFLFDGQNLFDCRTAAFGHEWQVDETLTRLITDHAIDPLIVVGLDNGPDRLAEYTFDPDPHHGGGRGADTAAFLLDAVLPWAERTYPLDPARRLLGGSSLGGLMALDVARRHRSTFAGLIVASPSLWWADEATLDAVAGDPAPLAGTRVWLDVGTAEEPGPDGRADVARVRRLDAALSRGHVEHRLQVDPGAAHNETAWARRFPAMITYLMTGR